MPLFIIKILRFLRSEALVQQTSTCKVRSCMSGILQEAGINMWRFVVRVSGDG